MRKRLVVVGALICVLALVAGVILVSGAGAATSRRVATLTGENEVAGPGDPDGSGRASIRLNIRGQRVCFDLSWKRIQSPMRADIHVRRRGELNPEPVVVFFLDETTALPGTIRGVKGCVRVGEDWPILRDIRDNPRRFYVDIHNENFPGGAIRGQLRRP